MNCDHSCSETPYLFNFMLYGNPDDGMFSFEGIIKVLVCGRGASANETLRESGPWDLDLSVPSSNDVRGVTFVDCVVR